MAQKFISLLLVLAFMSYQSYHSLVYLNYFVNYDYFVNVLCENKDNPEKPNCNGKCHLNKQLKQQKPPQEDHPFSKSLSTIFYPEILAILLQKINGNHSDQIQNNYACPLGIKTINPFIGEVFHPPKNLLLFS